MKLAAIGISHLAVCLAIATHEHGNEVVLFDSDSNRLDLLKNGGFETGEPGVREFLDACPPGFSISGELRALAAVDLVLIGLDTPFSESGAHDELGVAELVSFVSGAVPPNTPIVVSSQVRPGFMRRLEGVRPHLYYMMESLVFGKAIARAKHPERYVIGALEPENDLPPIFQRYLAQAGCPIHVMGYESAEFCKLAANFVLGASISAANTLASGAEKIGANWADVEPALREDNRIGEHAYISPGIGIGGANIMRDIVGVRQILLEHGADASFAEGMERSTQAMKGWPTRQVLALMGPEKGARVLVLGATYKIGTNSSRGSVASELIESLGETMAISIFDPYSDVSAVANVRVLDGESDLTSELLSADVIVIGTPHDLFIEEVEKVLGQFIRATVIDPYRVIRPGRRIGSGRVIQLGVTSDLQREAEITL